MLDRLLSFNAQSVNPIILEKTLTIRKKVVDDIESKCISKTLAGTTYQSLIIAPRGSGKTHIIKVLYHRLKDNNEINKKIIIAYMQEDPIGIANFTDLLLAILNSFELDVEKTEFIQNKIYKASLITNKTEQINFIKATLLEIVGKLKIILLIENFNKILKSFGKSEQAKLRDFIHQYNNISIIATSQSLIKVLNDSTYPFYNFFDVKQLEKLNFEQAVELIEAIAKTEENEELLSEISKPQFMSKLKAIYELTAGNHRLLVTFYNFLKAEYKSDLSVTFIKTMNDLKPYYEQFINNLPAQQQKIINYLSSKRKAVKGTEIAQFCFMNINTLSSQTSLLYNMGMIDKKKEGRDAYYELKEPLMRISFEVAQNRNGIAKLFVDFLSNFYESKLIRERYYKYKYGAKFQDGEIKAKYMQEAKMFELALPIEIKENIKIYDKILSEVSNITELNEKIETLDEEALEEKIMQINNFFKKYNYTPEKFSELLLGSVSLTIEEKNRVVNALPRLNKKQVKELVDIFEGEKIKFKELMSEYEEDLKKDKIISTVSLKQKILAIKDFKQKFNYSPTKFSNLLLSSFSLTIEEKNRVVNALPRLSKDQVHELVEIFELEIVKFTDLFGEELYKQQVLYIKKGIEKPLFNPQILNKIAKKLNASTNAKTFLYLGIAYRKLKDYKNAIKNYNKAIKLQPENADFYNNLGMTYLRFNNVEKAFENFKESIKLNPKNTYVKFSLLGAYIRINDLEKSKSVFEENISLADDNLIIEALHDDILYNIFKYGSTFFMNEFLNFIVNKLNKNKKIDLLLNNFSENLFDIMINIEDYDLERLNNISSLLKTVLKEYPAHIIPLKLFDVGIQYLKNKEKTALFNLTKEERKVFNEFVIEKRNQSIIK